jgi:crotonobetainyl-CoA:carnitine CoA-transferase CaiB-like acyl-CoA transferase
LAAVNTRLIYCSVTGFGQNGPYAHRAGYDLMVQGMGGIMDLTGPADGEPMRIGVAFADVFTGVYSALAIVAALAAREKSGRGSHVDMALLDTQVGVLANQASFYLTSGQVPHRLGNAHATVVPYQVFPVADGHIIIACGNDGQFAKLMTVLGMPQMAQEERYKTNEARVVNRATLIPPMMERTQEFFAADLLAKLEAVGVPAGPINDLAQVFADPQVNHRGMRITPASETAKGGTIPGVRTPIMFDGRAAMSDRPSPRLGEHTEEILREIGES